ncbi:MAG: hypothetical protein KJN89_12735 [Gammaproteobacteria bacterium]|nr:hypothetical protein [Gammaproteobacteria bacterium]NNJ51232.1 hypothetical protein [Gammaproteobacteria bacterium]
MKYLAMSALLLTLPAQAADNAARLDTQSCLQLIRDYWTEYETSGVEPAHVFEKFDAQCEGTTELDNLMLNDEYINAVIARLTESGVLK